MHVWMYVVGLLEKAATNCKPGDNADQISDVDKAVALYTGSEAREGGNLDNVGYFLYSLQQVECYKFGTCKKNDISPINTKIFQDFRSAKMNLSNGECSLVRDNARNIKGLMTVLLIQGLTRAMYELDVHDDFQETTQGMASAFAAAVLPLVNKCSEGSAFAIHTDTSPGKSIKGSFEVVKAAFERNYDCLGIRCEDVGGLANLRGTGYLKGAEACNGVLPVARGDFSNGSDSVYVPLSSTDTKAPAASSSSDTSTSSTATIVILAVALSVGSFVLGIVLACIYGGCKKKAPTNDKEKGMPDVITTKTGESATEKHEEDICCCDSDEDVVKLSSDQEIV